MRAGDFLRLSARLTRLGAPATTRRSLTEAIEADHVLSVGVTAARSMVDASTHPLATNVHRRSITNLITWPITGTRPAHLKEFESRLPRRGPTPPAPVLTAEERTRFFDHLLTVAERTPRASDPLLRRQAVYLLGFDGRKQVIDWLRDEWRHTGHRCVADGDVTGLLEARSASVALASAGDGTNIHDFANRVSDTWAEIANLNYWAYWIGEFPGEQTNDRFMVTDAGPWSGAMLLRHLASRLHTSSAHLPLNLHTVHTLVAARPTLLGAQPGLRSELTEALDRLTASGTLTRTGHDEVTGLRYALRMAER
jgi:hypothetical protein